MRLKRYLQDYENVVTTDEKGREVTTPVYKGKYFQTGLDKEGTARFKRANVLLLLAIVVLHFICGYFIASPGSRQIYIALPYAVAYFPILYLAFGIFRLPNDSRKYRSEEIGLSFDRVKKSTRALMVILAFIVLGLAVFLAFFRNGGVDGLDVLFLVLEALALGAAYILERLRQAIPLQAAPD